MLLSKQPWEGETKLTRPYKPGLVVTPFFLLQLFASLIIIQVSGFLAWLSAVLKHFTQLQRSGSALSLGQDLEQS